MRVAGRFPASIRVGVVAVEAVQRALQLFRQDRIAAGVAFAACPFGNVLADIFPEGAVHQVFRLRGIICDRDARHFDDAALDGVGQREIRDDPGKQHALAIAGTAEKERRGGQIVDRPDADLALNSFQAVDPDPRFLFQRLKLPDVVVFRFRDFHIRFRMVAMMRFVIDDDNAFFRAECAANAPDHLAWRFGERAGRAIRRQQVFGQPPGFGVFARQKGVIIGDGDLGFA